MRVPAPIPHFCRRDAEGGPPRVYGSESGDIAVRVAQVGRCLAALAQTFGPRQAIISDDDGPPANEAIAHTLDVVLVTTGDQHLVPELPRHLFLHCPTQADPRALGFACHALMREHAGRYDWFVYLEDDLEITDALFFDKLAWFGAEFGQSALLQPNRFEVAPDLQVMKMYVDGIPTMPEIPARFQDITTRPRLEATALGRRLVFKRVSNVHSGCFFVNAAQLARMAATPNFARPNAEFFGPLESAASLSIMQAFEVYKPARVNAAFLELHHLGRRFLMLDPAAPVPPPA